MADTLVEMLKRGDLGPANPKPGDVDPNAPAWPYPETEFANALRAKADRLPTMPHRLSMVNMLKGGFNAGADWVDMIHAAVTGHPRFVIGMPDVVHTPGQEDYRRGPISGAHIANLNSPLLVPTRGAPAEDRKGITPESYRAWQLRQEEEAADRRQREQQRPYDYWMGGWSHSE